MRNASIELLRFIAAAGVLFVHFEQFCSVETQFFAKCFVIVEFFFAISGYYMMKSIDSMTTEPVLGESVMNSFNKAKKIFPIYAFAFATTFIVRIITNHITDAGEILSQLFHFKWELFMLQMLGFNHDPQFNVDYLNGPGWYLSALFIAIIPAYYLARNHKKAFIGLIGPLSVVSIYCYIIQSYNTLDVGNQFVGGFIMLGLLRAFAGITFGALMYFIYKRIIKSGLTSNKLILMNAVEAFCYIVLVSLVVLRDSLSDQDTLAFLPVYGVLIVCGDLNITRIDKFLNNHLKKMCCYLGKMSMYFYLLHVSIVLLWKTYLGEFTQGWSYLAIFAVVFVFSALVMYIDINIRKRK